MAAKRLTVLAIDDEQRHLELLRRYIKEVSAYTIRFLTYQSATSGLRELQRRKVDILILDYLLPDMTGLEALRALRTHGDRRPVIIVTGDGNERIAVALMRAGADDYILKEDLSADRIENAFRSALERFDKENKRLKFEEDLLRLARFDSLTNLCNRRYFMDRFAQEVLRSRRYQVPLSVILLDVDHFKRVNDTYGHMLGDVVLSTIAQIMREEMRATDVIGRYGGEEFCAVLPETPLLGACITAERIRQRIAAELFPATNGTFFQVTCSIGLVQYTPQITDLVALLALADKALYQAKLSGRNRVMYNPS